MVRELDLKKPPSIAESIDWARALLLLGADDIDQQTFRDTMSIIVKHRTDLDIVAERVGVKLGSRRSVRLTPGQPARAARVRRGAARRGRGDRHERAARRVRGARGDRVDRPGRLPRGAGGDAGQVPGGPPRLRAGLRALLLPRGRARPRCELLDAFAVLERGRVDRPGRLPRGARRDAREVPGGPARLRARLRALLLPRRRAGRGARGRPRGAAASTPSDAATARPRGAARADRRRRSRDGDEGAMRDLARLAIAAFGRQGEGSRRHRRRRPAHPPRARPALRAAARPAAGRPAPRRACRARRSAASRRCCAASSSARRSSAPSSCRRRGR